jgi:hypothetical protein
MTQPFPFAFAQVFQSISAQLGNMEPIRANAYALAEHGFSGTDETLIKVRANTLDGASQALGNAEKKLLYAGLGVGCLNHNLLIFIKHFESHRDVFTLKLTPKEENNNLINMLY